MSYERIDLLLRVIDDDKEASIISEINNERTFKGFRKGNAPKQKILSEVNSSDEIYKEFLIRTVRSYCPEIHKDRLTRNLKYLDINELPSDLEYYPARLALKLLKCADNTFEFVQVNKEEEPRANAYIQHMQMKKFVETESPAAPEPEPVPEPEPIPAPEPSPEPESVDPEAADEDPEPVYEPEPEPEAEYPADEESYEEEEDEEEDEEPEEVKSAAPAEEFDYPTVISNDYLGYMQIKRTANNGKFYNFYPLAHIDEQGNFCPMDDAERFYYFPEFGNLNVYSSKRGYELSRWFENGRIYVINLEEDRLEGNYGWNGELNSTKEKVNLENLLAENKKCDSHDEPYYCYQVIDVHDFSQYIDEGKSPCEIHTHQPGVVPNKVVMLRDDQNRLIGPYNVRDVISRTDNQKTYWVDIKAKDKKFILDVYTPESPDALMTIQYYDGGRGEKSGNETVVNFRKLKRTSVDFLTTEMLIKGLNQLYEDNNAESSVDGPITDSPFLEPELPENIITERKERMLKILARDRGQKNMLKGFSDKIWKNALLDVVRSGDSEWDELFGILAQDATFMNAISRQRILNDAIENCQSELDQKQEELKALIQDMETKKLYFAEEEEKRLAASRKAAEEKLANYRREESNYINNREKYELADEIGQLRGQYEEEKTKLDQARTEFDVVQTQTSALLQSFQEQTEGVLSRIGELVLQDKVAKVLSTAMSDDKPDEVNIPIRQNHIDRYTELCAKNTESDEAMVERLVSFFKEYRVNYSRNDILNLYICLTQGFLTVLSGAPGIGKTSACELLAHSLGLDRVLPGLEMPRYVLVPVEKGWSSKRDLIGYYNPLTKTFDKSNAMVYNALEISDCECAGSAEMQVPPFAVLLDEANLSQMEYYWAEFMNVADRSIKEPRINLGSGKSFRISKSFRFLATINNDHTTETLSPRLIDRAWVVTLPSGGRYRDITFHEDFEPVSMERMQRVFGWPDDVDHLHPVCEQILKDVYKMCKESQMEVSERSKGAIQGYCITASKIFDIDHKNEERTKEVLAADFAIAQKILPKIHGHGPAYCENVLKRLEKYFEDNNLLKSHEIMSDIIRRGSENMNYYQFYA